VSVNSLEQPQRYPDVHRQDVQILGQVAVKERSANRTRAQSERLQRMRELSGQAEWSRVFMMQFVNAFVERAVMKRLVSEVMPDILEDEEESYLGHHGSPGGEWDLVSFETEHFADRVEEPDLGEFDGEVDEEDKFRAIPLVFIRRNLVRLEFPLSEVRDVVYNNPGDASSKVNDLVHNKAHQASCDAWVAYPNIPVGP